MSEFPAVGDLSITSSSSSSSSSSSASSTLEAEVLENARKYLPKDDSTIAYGALATNLRGSGPEKYYLTTAIAYTNGYPHIGHAYEFLTADVIVRYHRVLGYDTFFLTGSDEHGQKVANSAEAAGRTPIQHCDIFVNAFKALNQRLAVKYSSYIRTTDAFHESTAQRLWKKCADQGDIYLDKYEGWYNEREECFVPDAEAEAANFCDPGSGVPLKKVTEESYFFRMSRYADALIAHIEANPSFIEPEQYRNNILARLRKEGLKDLSVSRTSFSWGIPVPAGFDPKHVMYVWFDALTNYISGVYGLDIGADGEPAHPLSGYWPATKHVIGKDIIWFHCVIWPCMLMSAGVPLPQGVYSHGFVNAADGRKMSKSYNNSVDPHEVLDKYSPDSIRYYFCASTTYGLDVNFNESTLVSMHNSELADILGNLVHRALNLCLKYCNGFIPDTTHDPAFGLPYDLDAFCRTVQSAATSCAINEALFAAMEAARATNKYLTDAEPWKMKGADESRRPAVVRTTLEAVYAFAHFLAPVIPLSAQAIFEKLNTQPVIISALKRDFYNLAPGTPVTLGEILFKKIELEDPTVSATSASAAPAVSATAGAKVAKPTAGAKRAAPAAEEAPDDPNQPVISKVDLRVGRITRVWNHETADRLYCEEIDLGELGKRQVASGLRQHYTLEQMENRLVIVVCNLKEAKMQGFVSAGMVLAAKGGANPAAVELVDPPAGAVVGDRICVEGMHEFPVASANRLKKLKLWEAVAPDLAVNEEGVLCWQGSSLVTASGLQTCRAASITSAPVS